MRLLALLIALLTPVDARAVDLREVRINYRYFHESNRVLELAGEKAKEAINLGVNIDLVGPLYWNNEIKSLTTSAQYRFIAYRFMLGARVFRSFHVEYEHMSGHRFDAVDAVYPAKRFPVQDSLGFVWTVYSNPSGKSLF